MPQIHPNAKLESVTLLFGTSMNTTFLAALRFALECSSCRPPCHDATHLSIADILSASQCSHSQLLSRDRASADIIEGVALLCVPRTSTGAV
jgi:hypothetical protein